MALALIDQFTAAGDPVFQHKVTMAIQQAAIAVSSEAANTPNHANRVSLARAALMNANQFVMQFTFACAGQAADSSSTDTVINNAVSAVWNGIAGVP